ncbi:unnamed protein product [Cyprideis torosa]|uniref:Uncharacterized protein n=1 Tax=Cyprideis torosa TaxID=163714 RepID=A0A7R8W6P1_9CRUS|nr:unnamed protein product [Cyprideis torosa]CAG0886721.1 unnamed protein product [Cyprideis torosa]
MASLQSYPTVTATASILCGLMLMLPGVFVSSQLVNFIEEPGDLLLLPGQTGRLYCRVDVYGANIIWLSNGVPRSHDQKTFGADGSQISINESRSTGMDSWQCAAEVPGWGTVLSRKNLVRFVRLSSFKTEPQDQQVIAGNVARFECSVNRFPEAEITWFKDDEILQWDTKRMTKLSTGTLEIDNFSVRDIGCYHCNASLGGATISSGKGCVTVLTPSSGSNSPIKFIAEPRDISAREMFRRLRDSNFNITLAKFKLDAKNGNLKILNLQLEDAGMYQCEGQNSEGATFLTQPEQIFVVEDASLIDSGNHSARTSVYERPLHFHLESGDEVMNYTSNLKADPADSNYGSVVFRWDGPTDEKSKKSLIGYSIEYGCCREEVGRKKWTRSRSDNKEYRSCSQSDEGVDHRLNVHRLSRMKTTLTHVQTAFQPGDTRCFGRVRAMTMKGIGPRTDWVSYPPEALNETDVPDPPSNLHVTVTWEEGRKRGNNVSISWSPPENQTFWVRSYVVEWMQWDEDYKNDSYRKTQRLWPTQMEFHLSIDETSYSEISIKASNLAGESTAIVIYVNIRFHDAIIFTMESQSPPSWNLPGSPLKRVEVVPDSGGRRMISWSFAAGSGSDCDEEKVNLIHGSECDEEKVNLVHGSECDEEKVNLIHGSECDEEKVNLVHGSECDEEKVNIIHGSECDEEKVNLVHGSECDEEKVNLIHGSECDEEKVNLVHGSECDEEKVKHPDRYHASPT